MAEQAEEEEKRNGRLSKAFRVTVSLLCIILIVMVVCFLKNFANEDELNPKRIIVGAILLLLGFSGLGAIWGNAPSGRILAGLVGVLAVYYFVDVCFLAKESIFSPSTYKSVGNPINATVFLLVIGVPCLLFTVGARRWLASYAETAWFIFFIHVAGNLSHVGAKMLHLSGWWYFLAYLPLAYVVLSMLRQIWHKHVTDRKLGWRTRLRKDGLTYEELFDGKWVSIPLIFEQDGNGTHMTIYLPTRATLRKLPTWKEDRYEQILERITYDFDTDNLVEPENHESITEQK